MEKEDDDPSYTPDFQKVITEENNYIVQRRKEAEITSTNWIAFTRCLTKLGSNMPNDNLEKGSIGLALSGGGIRSATFNLGLLQSLSKCNILKLCDYLSTVSGGGYIGSCMTSLLNNSSAKLDGQEFPFGFDRTHKADERQEIKWLRRYGNYLFPNPGFFSSDTWNFVALFISGIILINIPTFYLTVFILYALNFVVKMLNEPLLLANIILAVAGVLLTFVVLIRAMMSIGSLSHSSREGGTNLMGGLAIFAFILAVISGLIWLAYCLPKWEKQTAGQVSAWLNNTTLATLVGLVAGLLKEGDNLIRKVMNAIFRVAQFVLLPIAIAQVVQYLWSHDSFVHTYYGFPWVVLAAIGLVALSLLIDLNKISMHHFYRDRLSKAYIIKRDYAKVDDAIESNEELKLKDMHTCMNGAPYHIINATANLPSSRNRWLRGRYADYFIFSKYYCGAESTGYRKTGSYDGGKTRLATAMAVSGAAVSPQDGNMLNEKMAFLLTLLNARLNRWMVNPNPKYVPIFSFLPYYYLKELLSMGSETGGLLNLSDGGHSENLGVYQLLKRRCAVIIASDAGADPDFLFEDLANLIAKARIDLGIQINLNLNDLRQDAVARTTKWVAAAGEINYPDGRPGLLIYLKACITGHESEDVISYRKANPSFPHQSTTDQFFDESQFESYRELGYFIGKEVFSSNPSPLNSPPKR